MYKALPFLVFAACTTVSAAEQSDCQAVFAREAECTDQFIPMLVDLRMKLDKPAGISKENRAELIPIAKKEWAEDSKPAAVEKTCKKKTPPKDVQAGFKKCLAEQGCDAFVKCIAPLTEKML